MDDAPQPPGRGADEALLEVASDKLKKEIAPLDQIATEVPAGNGQEQTCVSDRK